VAFFQQAKTAPRFVYKASMIKPLADIGRQEQAMYTDAAGTLNTGYYIKSTDKFNWWAQLVNYNKQPAKVYVTFDTEWYPGLVG
jgi:hypothetical protein